ncbi:siderophore-interacting protein [Saccharothrix xinjiangensis]|uniref:Siderophore-interacting protein n=1 Tax=Saccharothrix xinjiangensis TaxID=204798 RepID=A0ABV9YD38_9PSEU
MPRYPVLDQLQLKVLTKAAGPVMAPGDQREVFDQFAMTVTAVADLSPGLRRATFHADGFAGFRPTGPDERFGLPAPPEGRPPTMPGEDRVNVRASLRAMPAEDRRPVMSSGCRKVGAARL